MSLKICKCKGTKKCDGLKIPESYVPKELKGADRRKQIESICKGTKRPKVKFETRRSEHVIKFEKKYKRKITDMDWIDKNLLKKKGQELILNKARAAYFTSGSRPNTTPEQWAYARLASVLTGGKARNIDKKEYNKYKV